MLQLGHICTAILILGTSYVLYNVIIRILRMLEVLFIPNREEKL